MGRVLPGSVFKRCECRKGRAGLRLGVACPRLGEERGTGAGSSALTCPAGGGPQRRVRRGGYATEGEARAALARMREPAGQLPTLADWLELRLTTRVKLRSSTLRGYSAHVRLQPIPRLGMLLLAELDAGHLQRIFGALLGSDELSPASVRRVHSTLRTALNAAVREGQIGGHGKHPGVSVSMTERRNELSRLATTAHCPRRQVLMANDARNKWSVTMVSSRARCLQN